MQEINAKLLFKLEPEEAVSYLEKKGLKVTSDWREMSEEAHAKAFTISKMTDIELLNESKKVLETGIKEGWSGAKLERELTKKYKESGWWGKTVDKDGKEVQLGSAYRVRTIVRQNVQSAYNASRYIKQLQDVDFAPYFRYKAVMDDRTRPEHRALHNKIFRYDDPVWSTIYPPNGWGCRCHVESLTEEDIKSGGLKVESSAGRLTSREVTVNPETGEKKTISGIRVQDSAGNIRTMETDAGWNSNPGKDSWNLDVLAYKKILECDPDIQAKFISEMAQNPHRKAVFTNFIEQSLKKDYRNIEQSTVITWFTPDVIKALRDNGKNFKTPVITMKAGKTTHTLRKEKVDRGQALSIEQTKNIYDYINNPDEVYLKMQNNKAVRVIYVKYLHEDDIIDNRNCIVIPINISSGIVNYAATAERVNHKDALSDTKTYKRIR